MTAPNSTAGIFPLDKQGLLKAYRTMKTIRDFEERLHAEFAHQHQCQHQQYDPETAVFQSRGAKAHQTEQQQIDGRTDATNYQ